MATPLPNTDNIEIMRMAVAYELTVLCQDGNGHVDTKRLDSLLAGYTKTLKTVREATIQTVRSATSRPG